ncbi:cytochrome-c peroxidase [Maribacter hydrothermalis]|uniref:Cytochrome-c peroxidase n=1 Tax=Maribacter hydrothermalis TaxID=1836467 RepID=A0A1B7ZCF4_9FLAO|nr:cytochrome c peroxidase [Maribacter hydrothermalis]APQ16036.1 cytochrome-c peroxidase [Maribacter hydrothermalis]OBR40453.1 cytochrome-c peroxidase [Maribacter hydrothermalis]
MRYLNFKKIIELFLFLCIPLLTSCVSDNKKKSDQYIAIPIPKANKLVNALPLEIKSPVNNPQSKEKINLGRLLFFDPILSGDKDVACATCHHPDNGYAEFRDISIGVNGTGFGLAREFKKPNNIPFLKRNAHTIINTAFNGINSLDTYSPEDSPMFWDSRVNSLETQAIEPIKTLEEMRGLNFSEDEILKEVVLRLKEIPEYQKLFNNSFNEANAITIDNIGKAIAAYERTLITNNSSFDKYMRGDTEAISLGEKKGFQLFKKVGCINCHNGPMFSDYKIHTLSVPENNKLSIPDNGFEQQFGFRTPTLRNLRFTAPYMHNGTLTNLKAVLEFYEDLSFNKSRNPEVPIHTVDSLAKNLTLRVKDMSSIISFLNTLNDDSFDKTIPEKVPSGLEVGGEIN